MLELTHEEASGRQPIFYFAGVYANIIPAHLSTA
jgi:hypothetical protein